MAFQDEVNNTVEALKAGKTILYPTDTIWGLGCDATNPEAVKKIYGIKERDESKAMIILIYKLEQLRDYVVNIPDIAWDIVDFSEKPLTVIYPKGKNLANNLLPEDGSVAIRLVRDPFCEAVLKKLNKPLVSSSANISAKPSPATFKDIDSAIIEKVDYVVQHRQNETEPAKASVIMKIELDGEVKFIRK